MWICTCFSHKNIINSLTKADSIYTNILLSFWVFPFGILMLLANSYTFSSSFQSISQCLYNNHPLHIIWIYICLEKNKKKVRLKEWIFHPYILYGEKSKIHPSGSCIDKNDVEKWKLCVCKQSLLSLHKICLFHRKYFYTVYELSFYNLKSLCGEKNFLS